MGILYLEEVILVLQVVVVGDLVCDVLYLELVYVYLESEQQEKVIDLLQVWCDKEFVWCWSNGKLLYVNWLCYEVDFNLVMVCVYSGDLVIVQYDLELMVDIVFGNGGLQSVLGSVYMMCGWLCRVLQ